MTHHFHASMAYRICKPMNRHMVESLHVFNFLVYKYEVYYVKLVKLPHTVRDPLPPHCKLLLTLHKLFFSSCCCYYLIGSNVRWVFMLSSARLHNGFVNSHFCWTLASVSLTFPKRVILAITNLDSNLVVFHQQLLWGIDLMGS